MKNSKGVILPVALGLMAFCSLLGLGAIQLADMQGQSYVREVSSTQAFWLADAGLQRSSAGACLAVSGSLGAGTYNVVTSGSSSPFTLVSTGTVPGMPDRIRRLQSSCTIGNIFNQDILAKTSVKFENNSVIDSYNSSLGVYSNTNKSSIGAIVSNGGTGSIDLANNNSAGLTRTINAGVTIHPVTLPSLAWTAGPPMSALAGNKGTALLTTGNYQYTSINITGNNAVLSINGDVVLYLSGNPSLTIANNGQLRINTGSSLSIYAAGDVTSNNNVGFNNLTLIPSNFFIYNLNASMISISNNGTFYGVIYAPSSTVILKNNDNLYGAIVGNIVDASQNVGVHFDTALSSCPDLPPFTYTYDLSNWAELP